MEDLSYTVQARSLVVLFASGGEGTPGSGWARGTVTEGADRAAEIESLRPPWPW